MRTVWVLRGEAPDDPTPEQLAEADACVADARRDPRRVEAWRSADAKRVLIVGGGFAGMYAAMQMKPPRDAGTASPW